MSIVMSWGSGRRDMTEIPHSSRVPLMVGFGRFLSEHGSRAAHSPAVSPAAPGAVRSRGLGPAEPGISCLIMVV